MSEEEIKRIENTINENKDYREHFHLHDYFEVEYIDKLLTSYKQIQQENQSLKKQLEEAQENIILLKASKPMLEYKKSLEENQQKEFIEYLENEKDRLSRECSQIYEDSLGKTRLVNKDIFNEVDKNLAKYKEITGVENI